MNKREKPNMEANEFYVVWNPKNRNPLVRHETFLEAQEESKRLSQLHIGHQFYVLKSQGHSISSIFTTFTHAEDD